MKTHWSMTTPCPACFAESVLAYTVSDGWRGHPEVGDVVFVCGACHCRPSDDEIHQLVDQYGVHRITGLD